MDSIDQIKAMIAQGDTEKALAALVEYTKEKNPNLERQALLLSGQYKQWRREKMMGVAQSSNELRRIELSIMELVDADRPESVASPAARPAPALPTKKSSNLMPALLGLAGIVIIGLGVLFFFNRQPVNAAENPIETGESLTGTNGNTEEQIPGPGNDNPQTEPAPTVEPASADPTPPNSIYQTVRLADHTWMSTNLNEPTGNSICYDQDDYNCYLQGRLYTFAAAKKACADLGDGWRLPNNADWKALTRTFGGAYGDLDHDGKQAYQQLGINGSTGFNGAFGGKRIYSPEHQQFFFYDFSNIGYYWVDQDQEGKADHARMYTFRANDQTLLYESIPKTDYISCRCVKD